MKNLIPTLSAVALLVLGAACHRHDGWTVKGDVDGADGQTMLLEASNNGRWYVLDSAKLSNNGSFKFEQPAASFPAIYRLTIDGKSAYFPIDSIDEVVVKGSLDNFASDYQLSGTPGAENLNKANALLMTAGNAAANEDVKRQLSEIILADPAGITAFYIISSHAANGKPIFDPKNKLDLRLIGAVANAYTQQRPADPRTHYLKNLYLGAKAANNGRPQANTTTVEVPEMQFPEIALLDENGLTVALSDIVAQGPTLVNFTRYTSDYSPALNIELAKLAEELAAKGLKIYQIGFDQDEYEWRQAAKNLPWTTVFNSPKDGDAVLRSYNVAALPTTFIINSNGELVERVTGLNDLSKTVKEKI